MSRKAIQPDFDALNIVRLKRIGGDPLSAEEQAMIDELIDAVIADRNPLDKYWCTVRAAGDDSMKKLQMAMRVEAKKEASPEKSMDELWGEVAYECGSTYDVVAKAWASYQKM